MCLAPQTPHLLTLPSQSRQRGTRLCVRHWRSATQLQFFMVLQTCVNRASVPSHAKWRQKYLLLCWVMSRVQYMTSTQWAPLLPEPQFPYLLMFIGHLTFTCITSLNYYSNTWGRIKKLRLRRVKQVAPSHTVGKMWSQDSNPSYLAPGARFITTTSQCLSSGKIPYILWNVQSPCRAEETWRKKEFKKIVIRKMKP